MANERDNNSLEEVICRCILFSQSQSHHCELLPKHFRASVGKRVELHAPSSDSFQVQHLGQILSDEGSLTSLVNNAAEMSSLVIRYYLAPEHL